MVNIVLISRIIGVSKKYNNTSINSLVIFRCRVGGHKIYGPSTLHWVKGIDSSIWRPSDVRINIVLMNVSLLWLQFAILSSSFVNVFQYCLICRPLN